MSDKTKPDLIPAKNTKPKRPSTVSIPSSSRTKLITKEKSLSNTKKNDVQNSSILTEELSLPKFDEKYREMAYSRFMSDVFNNCVVEEKIEREETPIELLMTQLGERFRKTMDQLDKTSDRLKNISFVVEQKRLTDIKNNDSSQFYNLEDFKAPSANQSRDKISMRQLDFKSDKNSGHKQLLDTVNDAIEGLEKIKMESNLDMYKFQDFSEENMDECKDFDVESIKSEFEAMFPKISGQLLQETSEKIAKIIDADFIGESDDD